MVEVGGAYVDGWLRMVVHAWMGGGEWWCIGGWVVEDDGAWVGGWWRMVVHRWAGGGGWWRIGGWGVEVGGGWERRGGEGDYREMWGWVEGVPYKQE